MFNKNVKLPAINKALLIYILSASCGLVLTPLFYKLYSLLLTTPRSYSISAIFDPSELIGFIYGYIFFVAFFTFTFIEEKQSMIMIWLIGVMLMFLLFIPEVGEILFILILSLLGFLLAQLVLLIKKQVRKKE